MMTIGINAKGSRGHSFDHKDSDRKRYMQALGFLQLHAMYISEEGKLSDKYRREFFWKLTGLGRTAYRELMNDCEKFGLIKRGERKTNAKGHKGKTPITITAPFLSFQKAFIPGDIIISDSQGVEDPFGENTLNNPIQVPDNQDVEVGDLNNDFQGRQNDLGTRVGRTTHMYCIEDLNCTLNGKTPPEIPDKDTLPGDTSGFALENPSGSGSEKENDVQTLVSTATIVDLTKLTGWEYSGKFTDYSWGAETYEEYQYKHEGYELMMKSQKVRKKFKAVIVESGHVANEFMDTFLDYLYRKGFVIHGSLRGIEKMIDAHDKFLSSSPGKKIVPQDDDLFEAASGIVEFTSKKWSWFNKNAQTGARREELELFKERETDALVEMMRSKKFRTREVKEAVILVTSTNMNHFTAFQDFIVDGSVYVFEMREIINKCKDQLLEKKKKNPTFVESVQKKLNEINSPIKL